MLIQIFADILSYLRLYALGLAGALVNSDHQRSCRFSSFCLRRFNCTALGHCVNIVLGIMGGVIHGLRLNFLEWYHYCFEGGGKMFNPLKKQDIEK